MVVAARGVTSRPAEITGLIPPFRRRGAVPLLGPYEDVKSSATMTTYTRPVPISKFCKNFSTSVPPGPARI